MYLASVSCRQLLFNFDQIRVLSSFCNFVLWRTKKLSLLPFCFIFCRHFGKFCHRQTKGISCNITDTYHILLFEPFKSGQTFTKCTLYPYPVGNYCLISIGFMRYRHFAISYRDEWKKFVFCHFVSSFADILENFTIIKQKVFRTISQILIISSFLNRSKMAKPLLNVPWIRILSATLQLVSKNEFEQKVMVAQIWRCDFASKAIWPTHIWQKVKKTFVANLLLFTWKGPCVTQVFQQNIFQSDVCWPHVFQPNACWPNVFQPNIFQKKSL